MHPKGWSALALVWLVALAPAQVPRWLDLFAGPGGNSEEATALCRDSAGNSYLAIIDEYHFIVAAVNPAGIQRWVYRLTRHDESVNSALAVTVGNDGNIYAAGALGTGTDATDFAIVSLTPDGNERWIWTTNGPGGEMGEALALVWGRDGNIYAAGWTSTATDNSRLTVASLTPAGRERWTYINDDPGNRYIDRAYAVCQSPDNSIMVGGTVGSPDTTYQDMAVICLDTAGNLRWQHRVTMPSPDYDVASAICCDSAGNVYAAGELRVRQFEGDFAVVSLTPDGQRRWLYLRDGPGAGHDAALGLVWHSGRVFTCGRTVGTDGTDDWLIAALDDSTGAEDWCRFWHGDTSPDYPRGICLDAAGNIVVAGSSGWPESWMVVQSLTPGGSENWTRTIQGPVAAWNFGNAVVPTPAGRLLVAGMLCDSLTAGDAALLDISIAGIRGWTWTWDSDETVGADEGLVTAWGPDSTIYTAGFANWGSTMSDITLACYSADGSRRWVWHWPSMGIGNEELWGLAVDAGGTAYVCGQTAEPGLDPLSYFTVAAIAPDGQTRWLNRYSSGSNANEIAWMTAIGPDSNIYVCGQTFSDRSLYDLTLMSFDRNGSRRWVSRADTTPGQWDFGYSLACGPDSSIYVCGMIPDGNDDCFAAAGFRPDGSRRWVWTYNPPGVNYGLALSIACGPDGNIYLAGYNESETVDRQFIAASLDPDGHQRWLWADTSGNFSMGLAIACGPDSTIYAGGTLWTDETRYWDAAVLAFDPAGNLRAVIRHDNGNGVWDLVTGLSAGPDSMVYASALTWDRDEKQYCTCLAVCRGRLDWAWRIRGTTDEGNRANWVAAGPGGKVALAGTITSARHGNDMLTAMFASDLTALWQQQPQTEPLIRRAATIGTGRILLELVPDPARPLRISLYDATGRCLVNRREPSTPGTITLDQSATGPLPAGIYTLKLQSGPRTETRRLTLIR